MYYVVLDEGLIRKYLSKEDVWLYRNHFFENLQRLGDIGLGVAEALRQKGFQAAPQSPNGVYRPGSNLVSGLIPPFSLRYGCFAAGLGHIGRSGLLITPEYGARVQLGGVITDAPLEPDSPLDENPCEECLICIKSCPTGFMSAKETVTFTLGGRQITHAKKAIHARCAISCGGLTGLSAERQVVDVVDGPLADPQGRPGAPPGRSSAAAAGDRRQRRGSGLLSASAA